MFRVNVSKLSNDINSKPRKFRELDSLRIKDYSSNERQQDSCLVILASFNSFVKNVDGRYKTKLLWKSPDLPLNDNKDVAETRLADLLRKQSRDDCLLLLYECRSRQSSVPSVESRKPKSKNNVWHASSSGLQEQSTGNEYPDNVPHIMARHSFSFF